MDGLVVEEDVWAKLFQDARLFDATEGRGIDTKLIIAKNRNGATDIVNLVFHPKWTRFDAASRVDDKDIQD